MKPISSSPISLDDKLNRERRLPTVHFANMTEPLPTSPTMSTPKPTGRLQPGKSTYIVPNPISQYQYRRASVSVPMSTRMRTEESTKGYTSTRPNSMLITRPNSMLITRPKRLSTHNMDIWTSPNSTVPPVYANPGPGRSFTPLSNHKSIATSSSGSRITSCNSNSSKGSMQSTSTIPSTPPNTFSRTKPYDPLQHYIPCLYPNCSAHYTPTHAGSMYYVPQGSYSLTRLHGYCPRHVTKELADATAQCKREWETMRQSAGRKTLGQIDQEFDRFMEQFRDERQAEDARLQQDQRSRLVSAGPSPVEKITDGKTKVHFDAWDWRYTPRRCTTPGCKSSPYSPYASHLYAIYTTPRPSGYTPLPTLCPACAKAEVATFEQKVAEKWASRSEWEDQAWDDWLANVTRDRAMEVKFGEKAQEKAIRGKGPARRAESTTKPEGADDRSAREPVLRKKRSLFRRLFSKAAAGN